MSELKNLFKDIKFNNKKVAEYEIKEKKEKLEQRELFLLNTTPEEFIDADIKKMDKKISSILNDKKTFCWIWGKKGRGKTFSLYALRNFQIMEKGNLYFNIKMEGEINYDVNYKKINAVDNIAISDSKMKYLADFYFNLIDWCYINHKKLFLTSTKNHDEWIEFLSKYNMESAEAISSRFSNNINVIELDGPDRRRIK